MICFMAVLYGHILNPPQTGYTCLFPVTTSTRGGAGGRPVDGVDVLCSKLKFKKNLLQDMSHLLQCLSSGASDDISCKRKHVVYFNL